MDPRLLKYYNGELQHLREMSGEFAREFPKIAGRLGLDGFECADPYVERLIEGFAFLAARVRLKVDAEFPRFTQHLFEMVYPHYLAPLPSLAVVRFQPTLSEGGLAEGFPIPRGTALRGLLGKGDQTPCEYRTAHDLALWPLELTEAEYYSSAGAVAALGLTDLQGVRAALRLRLRTTAGLTFDKLSLNSLPLFLRGGGGVPMRLYEQLLSDTVSLVARPAVRPTPWREVVRGSPVRPLGFEQEQAMLPYGQQSFDGYRLLHEYFAFPARYMFVELTGLGSGVRRCETAELDIIVLFKRSDSGLENAVNTDSFSLFCTPAINLFPKRADRVHLTDGVEEHHVIPDRTRPMDFEVYQVTNVKGFGVANNSAQEFLPFFAYNDYSSLSDERAFFTVHRELRMLSTRMRSRGRRSSYVGSELFISLVDGNEAPYSADLRQLAVETLCTNRDLPLEMPIGKGSTDFTLQLGAPVDSIRCIAGPTRPKPSFAEGAQAWQLISHLSLNYLSLADSNPEQGAAALRELLMLYADLNDASVSRQIEGVRSISTKPVVRRALTPGPVAFLRGLEVTLTCSEESFEGMGSFLLGAVLERFFAKYATINSFTETVLREVNRGEIMRWHRRIGQRHVL